ncbi:prepilin peptidase [Pseudoalteromonas piscicida]|uniref:Prepilin leader peptidase/N-methyltransferase n=1 Tax=Pseudoalteromonas piscicida TaxID=43662 RepID=A0A2A5JJM8_PSEO7|nr:A24 family peptidase [Pseudoalteromonas piscicida]PCK29640.1 prepilin peptidase [Pseudoalteromonas piscicida]
MQDIFHLMQTQLWYWLLTVGLVSLCIGSFLNVVILRLPKMMQLNWRSECRVLLADELPQQQTQVPTFNLVKPNSHCPSCKTPIKAWQNIPLISWLLLKGKCNHCGTAISVRYPLVELSTALLSIWVAWHFGASLEAVLYIVITWVLVALTVIDIDEMLLPDQLTLPTLWLVLVASCFGVGVEPKTAIVGAAVGYLSLWSVYWLFKLLTGKEGMGYGDFKLLAVFGALMGWEAILTIVLLSSLVGAVIGSIQLSIQGRDKATPIPFGPYLAIAGWITLMYGEQLQRWYVNLIM